MTEKRTFTLGWLWEQGRDLLEKKGVPDAGLDAWYLLGHVWQIERAHYHAHRDDPIDIDGQEERLEQYRRSLQRRGRREPLQHILGYAWFMELRFVVNRHVLIPRQDTEVLVEEARKRIKAGHRVLDMCTGSGCILLSLLYHCPGAKGTGADISKEALEVARENSRSLDIPADFIYSDLFEEIGGDFDLIVSNPPYIPKGQIPFLMEEVREYDPREALDGGEDGLDFYRRLIRESYGHLTPKGALFLEIGDTQGEWVRTHMEEQGYREVRVVKDLSGLDRVVLGYKEV